MTAIGAGVGTGIDALVQDPHIIYDASGRPAKTASIRFGVRLR